MPRIARPSVSGVSSLHAEAIQSFLEIRFQEYAGPAISIYGLRPDIAQAYADAINAVTERFAEAPTSEAAE